MIKFRLLGLLMLLSATVAVAADTQTEPVTDPTPTAPMAVVEKTRQTLAAVIEGTEVRHDFIIKNEGNAPLEIEKVKTG